MTVRFFFVIGYTAFVLDLSKSVVFVIACSETSVLELRPNELSDSPSATRKVSVCQK